MVVRVMREKEDALYSQGGYYAMCSIHGFVPFSAQSGLQVAIAAGKQHAKRYNEKFDSSAAYDTKANTPVKRSLNGVKISDNIARMYSWPEVDL